nr:uncharacterized protein LOC131747818 isoform X2 [Kogia breviceps]
MSYKVTVKNLQENRKKEVEIASHSLRRARALGGSLSFSAANGVLENPQPGRFRGNPPRSPSASLGPACAGARDGVSARGRSFWKELLSFSLRWRERMGRPAAWRQSRRRSAAAMQAAEADAGTGRMAGGAEGLGSQGGRGVMGSKGGPCSGGAAAAADNGALCVAPAQHSLGPGGHPAPTARRPGSRPHVFALSVPFPSTLEAEIARGSLAPDAELHHGTVGKELTPLES